MESHHYSVAEQSCDASAQHHEAVWMEFVNTDKPLEVFLSNLLEHDPLAFGLMRRRILRTLGEIRHATNGGPSVIFLIAAEQLLEKILKQNGEAFIGVINAIRFDEHQQEQTSVAA